MIPTTSLGDKVYIESSFVALAFLKEGKRAGLAKLEELRKSFGRFP